MKVQELIDILKEIEDKSQIAHCDINANVWGGFDTNGHTFRINAHLPYNDDIMMITSKRKVK